MDDPQLSRRRPESRRQCGILEDRHGRAVRCRFRKHGVSLPQARRGHRETGPQLQSDCRVAVSHGVFSAPQRNGIPLCRTVQRVPGLRSGCCRSHRRGHATDTLEHTAHVFLLSVLRENSSRRRRVLLDSERVQDRGCRDLQTTSREIDYGSTVGQRPNQLAAEPHTRHGADVGGAVCRRGNRFGPANRVRQGGR